MTILEPLFDPGPIDGSRSEPDSGESLRPRSGR